MGHKSLETTMGYLHVESLSVSSPLETLPAFNSRLSQPNRLTPAPDSFTAGPPPALPVGLIDRSRLSHSVLPAL